MRKAIFQKIFSTAMAIFLLTAAASFAALYRYFTTQQLSALKSEAAYLSAAISDQGTDFLADAAGDDVRVTLVDPDGTVRYDTFIDPKTLSDHGDRAEVRQAFSQGWGESRRRSDTGGALAAYYAVRMPDGAVLRLGTRLFTPATLLVNLFTPLVLILLLAIVISFLLAARMSQQITLPLGRIDLMNPEERAVYPELRPLVRRISAQNRELQQKEAQTRSAHEAQDAMRREFTANVSHELKTPLTSISGYAELLQNGLVRQEDVAQFGGKIYREAQRLIVLVNDILRLSRLDEKDISEEKTVISLLAVCRETVLRLSPEAKEKNVTFRLSGQEITLSGVPRVVEEIVYNLCDNAVKYNKPGGMVNVSVSKDADFAVLEVRDTGIGIPEGQLDRIFERFYRVDQSHSRELGGTGLGLSIVKHGAAFHNAAVEVESKEGEGTLFRVRFPISG